MGRSELEFLGGLLHQTTIYAQAQIDALPADMDVTEEMETIEAVIAPAYAIAERMIALPAKSHLDRQAKAKAQALIENGVSSITPMQQAA
jgi:hypothetical protein